MNDMMQNARKLRATIETLSTTMEDSEAAKTPELFPAWEPAVEYKTGDRVQSDGVLYKALADHTAQETWTPVAAPSLWAKVLIPDENTIPEWEQPDSTNAYSVGDRVSYNGKIYESTINGNVWSPEAYPAGWKLVG